MSEPQEPARVVVVDLQMPFLSMVVLMVKWALAAIPALMILFFIMSLFSGLLFNGMFHPAPFFRP